MAAKYGLRITQMIKVQHFLLVCHINDTDQVVSIIMSKKTKRIENKDDYEKSSFKEIIEDMEDTKDKALE
jgi:hypothetical protein